MSNDSRESPESEEPKVRVSDRRRFTPEGEARDPGEADQPDGGKAAAAGSPPPGAAEPDPSGEQSPAAPHSPMEAEGAAGRGSLPAASFELLVLSLGMQAQMELGLGGVAEGEVPDLDLARHTIDLLGILQQKTKGNLSLEEHRLLENTLTELRFRYVQALEQINKRAKP